MDLLHGRDLWHQIQQIIGTRSGRVAAIAYVAEDAPDLLAGWGEGDLLVCNAGLQSLRAGSTSPAALSALVDRGVDVRSNGSLHAKVLVSRKAAVIGSMNASATSSTRLFEIATAVRDRDLIKAARAVVLGWAEESLAVDEDFLQHAREDYRPSTRRGGDSSGKPVADAQRVGYFAFDIRKPPVAVKAVIRQGDLRSWVSPKLGIDWSWGPTRERRGDWVVEILNNEVLPPAHCVEVSKARQPSALWTATWIERYDADPIDRRDFEADLLRRGYQLHQRGWSRQHGLVTAVHDCFGISAQRVFDAIGDTG